MTVSSGLVLFRRRAGRTPEILLVHPGGPFWANKDEHGWSIPKGEVETDEDPLDAARREFAEELGQPAPNGPFLCLGRLTGRKTVVAFAVEAEFDPDLFQPASTTEIEWPPRSGRHITIPEVDRAQWFGLEEARTKLHKGQVQLVDLFVGAISAVGDETRNLD